MTPIERFFHEFDGCARSLQPLDREALRHELATHLESSVRARVELGTPLDVAENEAVEAVGPVAPMVSRVAAVHRTTSRTHRPFGIALLFATVGGIGSMMVGGSVPTWLTIWLLSGIAAIVLTSWSARRVQWRSLGLAFLTAFLISTLIGVPTRSVSLADGLVGIDRDHAPTFLASLRASTRTVVSQNGSLDRALARYQRHGGTLVPRNLVPESGELGFKLARSAEEARRTYAAIAEASDERAAHSREALAALKLAESRIAQPAWQEIPRGIDQAFLWTLSLAVYTVSIHAVVIFIRWVVDEVRRQWRSRRRRTA